MTCVTAQQFRRKFGEYQRKARCEPVEIMRQGRRELVLMSVERYDWLMAAAMRSHRTEDLPDTIVEVVRGAKMNKRRAKLVRR